MIQINEDYLHKIVVIIMRDYDELRILDSFPNFKQIIWTDNQDLYEVLQIEYCRQCTSRYVDSQEFLHTFHEWFVKNIWGNAQTEISAEHKQMWLSITEAQSHWTVVQNRQDLVNYLRNIGNCSNITAVLLSRRFGSISGMLKWYKNEPSEDNKPLLLYNLGQEATNRQWGSAFGTLKLDPIEENMYQDFRGFVLDLENRPSKEFSQQCYHSFCIRTVPRSHFLSVIPSVFNEDGQMNPTSFFQ